MEITKFPRNTKSYLAFLIPLSVYIFKSLEVLFLILQDLTNRYGYNGLQNVVFLSLPDFAGNWFVSDFIEWFGVLYGILLPLILVRSWEQLDSIDREFDREADTIKILYEDLLYLQAKGAQFSDEIIKLLREYVGHVIINYPLETKRSREKFPELDEDEDAKRKAGDKILERIRDEYRRLIHSNPNWIKESEPFIPEIMHKLNEIVDIRGDRISLASQRLFQSLRIVALITSIIFVLPFYFVGFRQPIAILDNLLITGVILLVLFIYMIIDDLDEPFGGIWKVNDDSWKRVRDDMDSRNPTNFSVPSSEKIESSGNPETEAGV